MVDSKPLGLWLHANGCPHGPTWVTTTFSNNGSMFLEKGWKTFIRSRNFKKGDDILFRYDGDETLWAKDFDSDGDCVGCCMESPSSESYISGEETDSNGDEA